MADVGVPFLSRKAISGRGACAFAHLLAIDISGKHLLLGAAFNAVLFCFVCAYFYKFSWFGYNIFTIVSFASTFFFIPKFVLSAILNLIVVFGAFTLASFLVKKCILGLVRTQAFLALAYASISELDNNLIGSAFWLPAFYAFLALAFYFVKSFAFGAGCDFARLI